MLAIVADKRSAATSIMITVTRPTWVLSSAALTNDRSAELPF